VHDDQDPRGHAETKQDEAAPVARVVGIVDHDGPVIGEGGFRLLEGDAVMARVRGGPGR